MSESIRLLVCGGRDFQDEVLLIRVMAALRQSKEVSLIIHGGARGADAMAHRYASRNGITALCFLANWGKFGNAAGPIRNAEMLSEGKPDLVLAFPGGAGTRDMINRSLKAGVTVWKVRFDGLLEEATIPPMPGEDLD